MDARISDQDMQHLRAFPDTRKATVMLKIRSREPAQSVVLNGDNDFEKALLRLRRDGYGLIDLQPQETAFTTLWYRRSRALLNRAREEVAMLLWELKENGDSTTLTTWRV